MPKDLKLINPNTGNCPIFRSKRDAEITKKIYSRAPVLLNEKTGENPWGISFMRMFDMSNDSNLFETYSNLIEKDYTLAGNVFVKGEEKWLPLYEAKMFWQYDHRFGTYGNMSGRGGSSLSSISEKNNVQSIDVVIPYYWVQESEILRRTKKQSDYFIAYRNITNATNIRTCVCTIIPKSAVGNSAPLIYLSNASKILQCCFIANQSSICCDYVVRQKMGGMNFNFYIMNQLPIFTPAFYSPKIIEIIVPKVIELIYTAYDLDDFAKDILQEIGPEKWNTWFPENPVKNGKVTPFIWDEEKRFTLQRELDAIYARLYGISKSELSYILDTFPIIMKKEVDAYGEYISKNIIQKYYDEYDWISVYSS